MARPPGDLVAAYRAAGYEVFGEHPALLRVGEAPGAHDQWLDAVGHARAAVITAANPFSRPTPAAANRFANRRLSARLAEGGLEFVPARGRDAAGRWSEEGFCVFGASDGQILRWLVEFRQNAAVRLVRGRGPELLWHPRFDPEPR
jgi:hypothetical protein